MMETSSGKSLRWSRPPEPDESMFGFITRNLDLHGVDRVEDVFHCLGIQKKDLHSIRCFEHGSRHAFGDVVPRDDGGDQGASLPVRRVDEPQQIRRFLRNAGPLDVLRHRAALFAPFARDRAPPSRALGSATLGVLPAEPRTPTLEMSLARLRAFFGMAVDPGPLPLRALRSRPEGTSPAARPMFRSRCARCGGRFRRSGRWRRAVSRVAAPFTGCPGGDLFEFTVMLANALIQDVEG